MSRALAQPVRVAPPQQGLDGRTVLSGHRAPIMTDGRIGDFWIDLAGQRLYGPKSGAGWPDKGLIKGDRGWVASLAIVADGTRRVHRVVDWIGGEGTKPATGQYVGSTGLVASISQASDIRGAEGPEMLISGLAAGTGDASYETLTAVAEDAQDNKRRKLKDVLSVGGSLDFLTVADAQAAIVPARAKSIRIAQAASNVGGPGHLRRRVGAEPGTGPKHRSADRFLPDGTVDSVNGGWWALDSASVDQPTAEAGMQPFGTMPPLRVRQQIAADPTVAGKADGDQAIAGEGLFFPSGTLGSNPKGTVLKSSPTDAREGLQDIRALTPYTGAIQGRSLRAATGRQIACALNDAVPIGAGTATVVSRGPLLATPCTIDSLYVRLSAPVPSGQSVTARLLIEGVSTGVKTVMEGGSSSGVFTFGAAIALQAQKLSVAFTGTSGITSGAFTTDWSVGFVPMPLDRPYLYSFLSPPERPPLALPATGRAVFPEAPPVKIDIPQVTATQYHFYPTLYTGTGASTALWTAPSVTLTSAPITHDIGFGNGGDVWRHAYNGVYGCITINKGTASQAIIGIVHGEDKNEIKQAYTDSRGVSYPAYTVQNKVYPSILVANCAFSYGPNTYCFASYAAFSNLTITPSNSGNGYGVGVVATELGPFLWPRDGYVWSDGSKAGDGLRHPSVFQPPPQPTLPTPPRRPLSPLDDVLLLVYRTGVRPLFSFNLLWWF